MLRSLTLFNHLLTASPEGHRDAPSSLDPPRLCLADTRHPLTIYGRYGGRGRVCQKPLIPDHLSWPWSSVAYVLLPAGPHSIGEHRQSTEAIALILEGTGALTTDGQTSPVQAGILAILPQGTRHALANTSQQDPLAFLLVELETVQQAEVRPPRLLNLFNELHESEAFPHPLWQAGRRVLPVVATVDLSTCFAGPWGSLDLLGLPAGSATEQYVEPEHDQFLFVMRGHATLLVTTGPGEEMRIEATPGTHQSVLVPCSVPCRFANRATSGSLAPLLLARLQVRPATQEQIAPPGQAPGPTAQEGAP